jgi:4-carboxymuconolactone decarboxylase
VPDHARLPRLHPSELDHEQTDLYEAFVRGPRQTQASFFAVTDEEGLLSGPYRAMLLSPSAGRPLERLGRAIRYELSLPARARELAILTVAIYMESEVEWRAHEALALSEGVPEPTVLGLQHGEPTFIDEQDVVVHSFTKELLESHSLQAETFNAILERFGLDGVFELVVTVGYYQTIAHINNAFDLRPAPRDPAPAGDAE